MKKGLKARADTLKAEADRLREEVQRFESAEVDQSLMTSLIVGMGDYEDMVADLGERLQQEQCAKKQIYVELNNVASLVLGIEAQVQGLDVLLNTLQKAVAQKVAEVRSTFEDLQADHADTRNVLAAVVAGHAETNKQIKTLEQRPYALPADDLEDLSSDSDSVPPDVVLTSRRAAPADAYLPSSHQANQSCISYDDVDHQRKALEEEREQFKKWKEEETKLLQLEVIASRSNLDDEQRAIDKEKARLEELSRSFTTSTPSRSSQPERQSLPSQIQDEHEALLQELAAVRKMLLLERARVDSLQQEIERIAPRDQSEFDHRSWQR
jgi:hypothetical protein